MDDTLRETFAEHWRKTNLQRLEGSVAHTETVTARTLAAIERATAAAVAAQPDALATLPRISLGYRDPEARPSQVEFTATEEGRDLVVLRTLGEGGMGRVLLARQRSLGRDVAVKLLKPEAVAADGAEALVEEARVMGGVEHPNIVPVHALGCDDEGHPLLVMKRIEGTSWDALLADPEHPSWAPLLEAHGDRLAANLEILARVADAAHFAHSRGIVHRDIKTENVMVGAFGEVYLVDWGIALRVPAPPSDDPNGAALRGTPALMAPEMAAGETHRIDARTDVYLLGATLHEVLTGAPRHRGKTLFDTVFAAYRSEAVAYGSNVPVELAALCNEATARDLDDRPATAKAFRGRVAAFGRHRASLTLSAAAHGRLRALETLMRDPGADASRVHALAVECRFGFAQALEVWDANTRAREGLHRTLALLFAHEVQHENLDAARSIAAERGDASVETMARLAALEKTLADRRAHADAAQRDLAERDFTRGAGARLPLLGVIIGMSIAIQAALGLRGPSPGRGMGSLVGANFAVMVAVGIATIVWRRALLVNRVNRHMLSLTLVALVAMMAHRLLVLRFDPGAPLEPVLAVDLVFIATAATLGAVTVARWITFIALFSALGALAIAVVPAHGFVAFAIATNASFATVLWFGWFRGRAPNPAAGA